MATPDLRPGADACYKCSACDTECPVAAVDDEFPGPKFQGPEQWRLKRTSDADVDDSVTACSNCMRCDGACPSDVPLSQMHNTARAEYVAHQQSKLSRVYVRNRLLANYGRLGGVASRVPRLANALAGNRAVRWLTERLLGVTAEREFPAFAAETFTEWWDARGGDAESRARARAARAARDDADPDEREGWRVAYFHGDYADYNTPGVAKALVRVFESFGYEVRVPDQRCSGTPMFANGMLDDARRAARFNVETFADLVADGYDVVCSCTSCSMALRQEYPELFEFEGTAEVAAHTYEAVEYLRIREDLDAALEDAATDDSGGEGGDEREGGDGAAESEGNDADGDGDGAESDGSGTETFAYHAPCHARNQGLHRQALEVFDGVEGVTVEDVGDSCSGISGTYGWKSEKYDVSMAIGEEMITHMEAVEGETGLTECPTCAMQMEHGTGYEVRHPLELLEAALV